MGDIVLAGATSGTTTLTPTAVSGTTTLTLPATTSTLAINGPAFSATNNATQSITQSTFTKVSLQTEEFDTNSNFDSTTNYRFTPTVAGYYQVTAAMQYTTTQGAEYILMIYKNGSNFKTLQDITATGLGYGCNGTALIYCNGSTDYLEMYVYTANAITRTIASGAAATYFQACMIRSA